MNFEAEDKKPLILPTPNPLPKIELPLVKIKKYHFLFQFYLKSICRNFMMLF